MNKEILITGTDGFIGNYLKNFFQSQFHKVTGTVYNLMEPSSNEVIVNFCNDNDFSKIPDKSYDAIIHVVGSIDQGYSQKKLLNINSEGTRRIVEWAEKNNCQHFIQISSISVYGLKLLGENITEETKRSKIPFLFPY